MEALEAEIGAQSPDGKTNGRRRGGDSRQRHDRIDQRSRRFAWPNCANWRISAGVVVLDEVIQRRQAIDPRTVMGKGKLDELLIRAMQLGADAFIFDRELQPAQVRSISEATDLKVIDRSQVDSGHLCATRTVARRKNSGRAGAAEIHFAATWSSARIRHFRVWRVASADADRVKQNSKPIAGACAIGFNRLEKELASQRGHREQRRKERLRHACRLFPSSVTPTPASQRCSIC